MQVTGDSLAFRHPREALDLGLRHPELPVGSRRLGEVHVDRADGDRKNHGGHPERGVVPQCQLLYRHGREQNRYRARRLPNGARERHERSEKDDEYR